MDIKCDICEEDTFLIDKYGVLETYQCKLCGRKIDVRLIYLPDPTSVTLTTKIFDAVVEVKDNHNIRTLALKSKVKRVFAGYSNFYLEDLERQIALCSSTWNLGVYTESEVGELKKKAYEVNLAVNFVPHH